MLANQGKSLVPDGAGFIEFASPEDAQKCLELIRACSRLSSLAVITDVLDIISGDEQLFKNTPNKSRWQQYSVSVRNRFRQELKQKVEVLKEKYAKA